MAVNSPTMVLWAGCIIEWDDEFGQYSYRSNDGAWDESVPIQHFAPGVVGLTLLPDRGIDAYACIHSFGNLDRQLTHVLTHTSDTFKVAEMASLGDATDGSFTLLLVKLVNVQEFSSDQAPRPIPIPPPV